MRLLLGVLPVVSFAASGIAIRTEALPRAIQGVSYSGAIRLTVDGRCPLDDVHFSLASGRLPAGLQFDMSGISGVPREMGVYRFVVRADSSCTSGAREYELVVTGRLILEVSPETVEIQVSAGETAHHLESVLVSSTWRDLPYLISDPAEHWLGVRPTEGRTPAKGSALIGDRLILDIDPSKLEQGVHRQTITISAWQATGTARINVVVTAVARPGDAQSGK